MVLVYNVWHVPSYGLRVSLMLIFVQVSITESSIVGVKTLLARLLLESLVKKLSLMLGKKSLPTIEKRCRINSGFNYLIFLL